MDFGISIPKPFGILTIKEVAAVRPWWLQAAVQRASVGPIAFTFWVSIPWRKFSASSPRTATNTKSCSSLNVQEFSSSMLICALLLNQNMLIN